MDVHACDVKQSSARYATRLPAVTVAISMFCAHEPQEYGSTALPRLWECDPESPSGYGVLALQAPIALEPGERIGICIHTSHPDGLILRALRASPSPHATARLCSPR